MTDPDKLSEERQQLYAAIGEATTSWIAVEDQLANLFAHFVAGDAMSYPAKAAFHTTINFKTKLAMTDAAAQWRMDIDKARWHTFVNRLNRASKKRNTLAHFAIIRSAQIEGGALSLRLAPSLGDINARMRGQAQAGLTINDVRQHVAAFKKLELELSQFSVEIGAIHPVTLPESLARLLGLDAGSANASPENRTHIAPQPQPESSQE
jgi:hypothetical protein